jgi:hypothetical protein
MQGLAPPVGMMIRQILLGSLLRAAASLPEIEEEKACDCAGLGVEPLGAVGNTPV